MVVFIMLILMELSMVTMLILEKYLLMDKIKDFIAISLQEMMLVMRI